MSKRKPNGTGSISPYKDGWRGQYYDPEIKKQRSVYGKTYPECQKRLNEKLGSIEAGAYVPPDKMLTGAWLDFWFENIYTISTRLSTQGATASGIRLHLKPAIGKYPLQRLKTDHVQMMIRDLQQKGLSPVTIERLLNTLSQAMKQAVKMKKISYNPVDGVNRPKKEKPEIKFLNAEEQAALLRNLPDSTHGRAIQFILRTGVRVSEACGLKWKDIQEDGIHIERLNQTIKDWRQDKLVNIETLPKTSAGRRIIPATATLRAILNEQMKNQKEECLQMGRPFDGVNGYVFATVVGTPADRNNISRTLRSVCKAAGIESRGIHALRHTFATDWTQMNPDMVSLSKIIGHTDPAFTYRVYCHADSASMMRGMDMIERILQNATECNDAARR